MHYRFWGLLDSCLAAEEQINAFIEKHRPLPRNIALSEAAFWNEAQAAFLAEAVAEDSDWCELVDELDCLLREN